MTATEHHMHANCSTYRCQHYMHQVVSLDEPLHIILFCCLTLGIMYADSMCCSFLAPDKFLLIPCCCSTALMVFIFILAEASKHVFKQGSQSQLQKESSIAYLLSLVKILTWVGASTRTCLCAIRACSRKGIQRSQFNTLDLWWLVGLCLCLKGCIC